MEAKLKKLYFALLIPAIAGFIVAGLARAILRPKTYIADSFPQLAPLLFVLAVASGVAFPILLRTLFVNKNRNRKHITEAELLKFEQGTLYIALLAPYFCLAGFFLGISQFHFYGTVLASFYATYYFYPSQKRISYERKIFRAR
ncbi:MAG: hypothetical protein DRH12_10470 [Deltaproteobacteria bacterium]|nr:MAG: hypothetical protein DRH12_10470 [Deltaproteobacteria bacterium]